VAEPGCPCWDCGHRYLVDLSVPDDLWEKIGMRDHPAQLCGQCIMRRVEATAQATRKPGYMIVKEWSS
jgi:hypothetical protein